MTVDREAARIALDLGWRPASARRAANRIYWDELVRPIWTQLNGGESIDDALRPFLALRILGVFNLADLEPLDRLCLLACLAECMADDFDVEHLFTEGVT